MLLRYVTTPITTAVSANFITSATLPSLYLFQIAIMQLYNFEGYIPFAILQVFGFFGYIIGWIGFFLAWLLGLAIPPILGGLSALAGGCVLGYTDYKDTEEATYALTAAFTPVFQLSYLFYLSNAQLDPAKTFSMTALMGMSVVGVLVVLACAWVMLLVWVQIQKLRKIMRKDSDSKEKVEMGDNGLG